MKQTIQRCLNSVGYLLVRLSSGHEYESCLPVATYAPWNTDADFQKVWQAIRENTLVDIFRCWELWQLAQQTRSSSGAILEVGVWRGGTGSLMAFASGRSGSSAPVYLCDTFRGVVKAGIHDTGYRGGEHSDTSIPLVNP